MSIIRVLLKRTNDPDDISYLPNWRIGLSAAASWSWGVSLAVGMSIMYTKGLLPFIIWTSGNILALPLFGFMLTYFPLTKNWPRFIFPLVFLFPFVEFFCIILNLQGLFNGFGGNVSGVITYQFLSAEKAKYAVMAIGLFVVWYINKGGLKLSVLTDFGQYGVQLLAVILMAVIGYFGNETNKIEWVVVTDTMNGLDWAKFGFFGIIVGVMGTSHQWQRFSAIKEENVFRASVWGGFWFGIYMLFVGLTGLFFSQNILLGSIFLITMMALATSSMDSAVAGMEYVVKKFGLEKIDLCYTSWITQKQKTVTLKPYMFATVISIFAVLLWPYFIKMGMVGLWSFMARQRLNVVGSFIIVTVLITFYKKIKKSASA